MLHHASSGPNDRPPIIFLHGFMGSSADWKEIADALSDHFRCITVDLPGHGDSLGLSSPDSYTMEGASKLLLSLFTETGIEKAHIIGYSMGGRAALYFAVHHPSRCRKLVLESSSPGLESEDDRRDRRGVDEARSQRLESEPLADFLEEWYRQPLFGTYRERPELMRRMLDTRGENDPLELARSLRGMGTGQQPSLWDRLEDLQLPVLAMAGALDGKYVETARRMAVLMTNTRTAIIPNAGHNLHAERPDTYVEIVRDFLTKPT